MTSLGSLLEGRVAVGLSYCFLVYNVFIFTDKRGFQVHYAEKVSWKSCREDAVKLIRRANIWVM